RRLPGDQIESAFRAGARSWTAARSHTWPRSLPNGARVRVQRSISSAATRTNVREVCRGGRVDLRARTQAVRLPRGRAGAHTHARVMRAQHAVGLAMVDRRATRQRLRRRDLLLVQRSAHGGGKRGVVLPVLLLLLLVVVVVFVGLIASAVAKQVLRVLGCRGV